MGLHNSKRTEKYLCMKMHIWVAALFIVVLIKSDPKCPLM